MFNYQKFEGYQGAKLSYGRRFENPQYRRFGQAANRSNFQNKFSGFKGNNNNFRGRGRNNSFDDRDVASLKVVGGGGGNFENLPTRIGEGGHVFRFEDP